MGVAPNPPGRPSALLPPEQLPPVLFLGGNEFPGGFAATCWAAIKSVIFPDNSLFVTKKENVVKTLFVRLSSFLVVILLVASCGPSPEQIATMTASAWTATPKPTSTTTPTLTLTPIPYDLTVSVVDEAGTPIMGASIVFPESGSSEPVKADAAGKYNWTNLPGAGVTLNVTAQGYLPAQQTATLDRGPSEISVVMKRDPYGLLTSTACAAGEKLLYLQDFQSGTAPGWSNLEHQAQGWSIGEFPGEAGNNVAIAASTERINSTLTTLSLPENAVWRLNFRTNGSRTVVLDWFLQADQSRYLVSFASSNSGVSRQLAGTQMATSKSLKPDAWHFVEISTYQGRTEVWADGTKRMNFIDPNPLTQGTIDLVMAMWEDDDPNVIGYFDNITVCGLSAPFSSLPAPVPMPTTTP